MISPEPARRLSLSLNNLLLIFLDQFNKTIHGFRVLNMLQHGSLSFIDGDLVVAFADISPIGVGHLAGTVHDAAHHGDDGDHIALDVKNYYR